MRIIPLGLPRRTARAPLSESERRRRQLLADSDGLLEQVELLRLQGERTLPTPLRSAILALQARAGGNDAAPARLSPRWAQELIFSIQQKLMSANPRRPTVRAYLGRGTGMAVVKRIQPGVEWKILALPPAPLLEDEESWVAMADLILERALDRWAYAQHHALRAVRAREDATAALARVHAAWANYWELCEEAARVAATLERAEEAAA